MSMSAKVQPNSLCWQYSNLYSNCKQSISMLSDLAQPSAEALMYTHRLHMLAAKDHLTTDKCSEYLHCLARR
jgi:hypothetical protein